MALDFSKFYGDAQQPARLWQGGSQVRAAEITLDGKTHDLSARPSEAGGLIHAVFAAAERSAAPVHGGPGLPPVHAAPVGPRSPAVEGTEADRGVVRVAAQRHGLR